MRRTLQDQLKLKLRYDFTPTLEGGFTLGYWHQSYRGETSTFLRDAAGNPVYGGNVDIGGYHYAVPAAAFAPSLGESENWLYGLTLRTHHATGWNGEALASYYDVSQDVARTAASGAPGSQAGTVTYGDGTGWKTLDLKATYTPPAAAHGFSLGAHTLNVGYHYDNYFTGTRTYRTADWQAGNPASFANAFRGRTQTQALHAQDSWQLLPRWRFVYGARYEDWRAYGGARSVGGTSAPYPGAHQRHISPKASLSFEATHALTLRASIGRAYRFPTVGELFQGQVNGSAIVNNDPNLKPEDALSQELAAEWSHTHGLLRVAVFQENTRNALLTQTDTTTIPNVTRFQNIDKVRARGIETSYQGQDVAMRGLDLIANLAYTQSKILANTRNPASVGKYFHRIPLWRAHLAATYRASEKLAASLGVRFSGRQYNTLTNTDSHPDVYGGTSSYLVADAKLTLRPNRHSEIGVGVDNLFDERYFVYHPYPGRTFFIEAKLAL